MYTWIELPGARVHGTDRLSYRPPRKSVGTSPNGCFHPNRN
jgi:hypothetical protein